MNAPAGLLILDSEFFFFHALGGSVLNSDTPGGQRSAVSSQPEKSRENATFGEFWDRLTADS
jgi:hypothetical protein